MLLNEFFAGQINEGGNVFDNTVAINKEYVPEIVKQIKKLLKGLTVYPDIGSAGYKVQSGDMDLMIDAQELNNKFGVSDVKAAKKMLQELIGKRNLETKLSGSNVHIKIPLPDGQFGQVDVMVVPEAKLVAPYHQHGLRGNYDDPGFHGKDIFMVIASIAKSMNLKFEPFGAKLVKRDTGDLVARSRDDVARILLNPNATADDLNNVKTIMAALKDDPRREEKLAGAYADVKKGTLKLPEDAPANEGLKMGDYGHEKEKAAAATPKPRVLKTDMTGKTCSKCHKGKYHETSQQDDMDGVLHCTNCGRTVNRWTTKVAEGGDFGKPAWLYAPVIKPQAVKDAEEEDRKARLKALKKKKPVKEVLDTPEKKKDYLKHARDTGSVFRQPKPASLTAVGLGADSERKLNKGEPSAWSDTLDKKYNRRLGHVKKIRGEVEEEFTGYWKGTDKGTPDKKMVGANESATDVAFKNTYDVGDRVDSPLGTGTIVAVSPNINVDGKVKLKLDDPSKAGPEGETKDTYVLITTMLKHINEEGIEDEDRIDHFLRTIGPKKLYIRVPPAGTYAWLFQKGVEKPLIQGLYIPEVGKLQDAGVKFVRPGVKETVTNEEGNPTDKISMDVPLFIRMMEYAREDATDDMDLHSVTDRAIELMQQHDYLCMDNYDTLVGGGEKIDELSKGTLGAYVKKASDRSSRNANTAGRYSERSHNDRMRSDYKNSAMWDEKSEKADAKSQKRLAGITKATDRLMKEDSLDDAANLIDKARAMFPSPTHPVHQEINLLINAVNRGYGADYFIKVIQNRINDAAPVGEGIMKNIKRGFQGWSKNDTDIMGNPSKPKDVVRRAKEMGDDDAKAISKQYDKYPPAKHSPADIQNRVLKKRVKEDDDIDAQIDFHNQGLANANYKGPYATHHRKVLRQLMAKKAEADKTKTTEGLKQGDYGHLKAQASQFKVMIIADDGGEKMYNIKASDPQEALRLATKFANNEGWEDFTARIIK